MEMAVQGGMPALLLNVDVVFPYFPDGMHLPVVEDAGYFPQARGSLSSMCAWGKRTCTLFFFPGQNISNRRCSNLDYYPEQIIRLNYMKLLTLKNFNLKKTNFMWFNLKYCCKCARWDIFCPCLSPNKSLMVAHSPSPPPRDSFSPGQMAGFTQRLMSLESVYDPGRENPAHVVCDKELGL